MAQSRDDLLFDGWVEQMANPQDPSSTDENTYAYVRRYADGRVETDYFKRGEDKPVHVATVDRKQAEQFLAEQKAAQPETRVITQVGGDGKVYTITSVTDKNTGKTTTTITDPSGNQVGEIPSRPTAAERPAPVSASPSEQYIVRQNPDGTFAQIPNPNYQPPKPSAAERPQQITAPDSSPYIIRQNPDGTLDRQPNPNYDPSSATRGQRPTPISAGSGQRNITIMDPDGSIRSVDNPNFDQAAYDAAQAKAQASAMRDRLALAIQAGQLSEQQASNQYKRWFDENVTIPMQRAQEARARATELRQAQEAEDRRKQFAATYEQQRATTALSHGVSMANAFNANLEHRVGPAFGEQFAQALNAFKPGAPPATFTADAFTFKGPSIEEVAKKATANALKNISPYAQAIAVAGDRPLQVASYGPGTEIAAAAPPPSAQPIDYAGMIQGYLDQNPYVPGAPPEEEPSE